jgi:hypothetical protein
MKIKQFETLIREIPDRNQSFDIKRSIWNNSSQKDLISKIFDEKKSITLNRQDLFNSVWNLEEFVIKTLMWGYPTKGRGSNIDNVLEQSLFENIIGVIRNYQDKEVSIENVISDLEQLRGIGISTFSKFLFFTRTYINSYPALILDLRIISIINSGRFDELNSLKGISHSNAKSRYLEYIKTIYELSIATNTKPEQIELFLFMFGRNLSKLKGEECYDYD